MSNSVYGDRILARQLEAHQFDEDVIGKPLEIPPVNFTIPLNKKIQALSGPPYYAVRARQIEVATDQLMEDLAVEYRKMIKMFGCRPKDFAGKWKALIEVWPLDNLNDLIEKHNMYYPIEANLQIDMKTSAWMIGSSVWEPKEKITKESLLQQFPLDMSYESARD